MKLSEIQAKPKLKLSQVMGQDMGAVDGKPTPVRKMGSRFDAFKMAGIPGVVMTEDRPEDLLPAAGQALGCGFMPSVGFASAGETARQGVRAVRGEGFDPMAIGKTAAATAAGEGIFRGLGKMAPKIANRLMTSALKAGRPVLEKNPKLGLEALEQGIVGTRGQMIKKAGSEIGRGESELQNLLSKSPQKVNLKNVVSELGEMKRRAANVGDDATLKQLDDFEKFILSKSETIPITQQTQKGFSLAGAGKQ